MNGIISAIVSLFSFFADLVRYLVEDILSLFSGNGISFLSFFGGAAAMGLFFLFINLKKNDFLGFFRNFFEEYYLFFSTIVVMIFFLIAVSANNTLTSKKEEAYSLEKEKSIIMDEMSSRLNAATKRYETKLAEKKDKNEEEKSTALTETEQLKKDLRNLRLVNQNQWSDCQNLIVKVASFTPPGENTGSTVLPAITTRPKPAEGHIGELSIIN